MITDTNKPAPVAEPASEDCVDTALSTMQTALRAAWEGDYTKSARYVELTATRLEARDQHNPAKWLRIALEEMQGKRQPVSVHAMSVPAPAVDERTANSDSVDLAAASNGSPGGAVVYPPDGTASPFTVINLGSGAVRMGDAIHDGRLPALWFGTGGEGMGHEAAMNRAAHDGETIAVVTFANVDGLDVLLDVIERCRRVAFPGAPARSAATSPEADGQMKKD